ncbi:MAG: JAB domain-containing protein [Nitrospinae bacterium]|nr:JAB domain-containing protein [Nitrospinota bacterium]
MPLIKKYKPFQTIKIELVSEAPAKKYQLSTSRDVYNMLYKEVAKLDIEHFWVIPLTTKNQIIGINLVSMGSLTSSVIHPREVFKPAILTNAARVVLMHNHPSGDFTPSSNDRTMTIHLRAAGDLLDIKVLDHIIITNKSYYSFDDNNWK